MLGFMFMMFIMARRCCRSWMGTGGSGERITGGIRMENQSTGKWKGMQGSMMRSCMEMMGRRMPAATHDTVMHGAFGRWSKDMEQKILDLLDKKESVSPTEIASTLGVPEDVAVSLLHRLALKGKVRIGLIEKAK
jgi:hypothetical protein